MAPEKLYSAGECPVCLGVGALFFLKSRPDGTIFLMCPHCEYCLAAPLREGELYPNGDSVHRFAPGGVISFPTREEIVAAFSEQAIVGEYAYEEWGDSFFGKYLND